MRRLFQLRALLCLSLALPVLSPAVAQDTYKVMHTYPHDAQAFTQGLIYLDGHLYESTGLAGHSSLRMEDAETGRILAYHDVPGPYFAEGLTDWGDTLIQLTWQNHAVFVYDRATMRLLRTLPYGGEGWGLTHDGASLIESDGSSKLHFLDPATLRELRRVTVKDKGKPVDQLNELEFIHGQVWANIWHSNRIARIAPATGKVVGWIDLTGLLPRDEQSGPEAVLNGIAYDAKRDRLFVTGKNWPKLFEIRIHKANPPTP